MKGFRLSLLPALVLTAFAGLMFCDAAFAQTAARETSLLSKILGIQAGAFGIILQVIIILASVFMLGWAIECFINVRKDKIVPPEVIGQLQAYIDEGNLEGALQFCEAAPNILTRTIGAALNRTNSGTDIMSAAAEQQLAVEAGKLNTHISPLSLVTALGPMLGLFGTVAGMVLAFDTMAAKGSSMSPSDVAGSIGLALMSTVMGLIVAIPGMTFFWLFSNRVMGIVDDVGLVVDDMMDRIRMLVAPKG